VVSETPENTPEMWPLSKRNYRPAYNNTSAPYFVRDSSIGSQGINYTCFPLAPVLILLVGRIVQADVEGVPRYGPRPDRGGAAPRTCSNTKDESSPD
jgi:hypothetical protein